MFNYAYSVGGDVVLKDLAAFDSNFKDEIDIFEKTLAHEQLVTRSIHNLMTIAIEEKDYATQNFLQWFVKEQVEEEDTANGLLEQIKLVNGNPNGLFMMNKELAARTYTPAVIK